jgi:DNA-binding transcriptional regulator YdaS (Cro superfamily)
MAATPIDLIDFQSPGGIISLIHLAALYIGGQRDLARFMGVTKSNLSGWHVGQRLPTPEKLAVLVSVAKEEDPAALIQYCQFLRYEELKLRAIAGVREMDFLPEPSEGPVITVQELLKLVVARRGAQTELQVKSGVTRSKFSAWVVGEREIPQENLARVMALIEDPVLKRKYSDYLRRNTETLKAIAEKPQVYERTKTRRLRVFEKPGRKYRKRPRCKVCGTILGAEDVCESCGTSASFAETIIAKEMAHEGFREGL